MRAAVCVLLLALLGSCSDDPAPTGQGPAPSVTGTPTMVASGTPETEVKRRPRSVLLDELAASAVVRRAMLFRTQPRGVVRCGIDVLARDRTRSVLFAYLTCLDLPTGGRRGILSGSALAAVVKVSRGRDKHLVSVRFPRQARLAQDLQAMFPPAVVTALNNRDVAPVPSDHAMETAAADLPDLRSCRFAHLRARALSEGGPALGTWYLPIELTTVGPDCLVSAAELEVMDDSRPIAALDLRDHPSGVVVVSAAPATLRLSAPMEECVHPGGTERVQPELWSSIQPRNVGIPLATTDIKGAYVPNGFVGCRAARLTIDLRAK